jgi:hypothetical protein
MVTLRLRSHPVLTALAPFAFAFVALGCGKSAESGGDASGTDAGTIADAGSANDAANASDSGSAPDAAPPVDAATAADSGATADAGAPANACEALGGLCLGQGAACTNGGGTVSAAGASGCVFSDGPGVCCIPPAPQATGTDCRSHGGLCAPIAGCNFTRGNFAPPSCSSGPGIICCVPQKICGPETMACCNAQTTFRPACDRGTFVCTISGTTLKPRDQCP